MAKEAAFNTAKQLFKGMTQNVQHFDKAAQKCRLIDASPGRVVAELTIEREHCNMGDTLHGGLSATLVDLVSSFAFIISPRAHPGVSVNINTSYMRPGKLGSTVIIDAQVLKTGKSLGFATVDIRNKSDNSLVVQGTHTKSFPNY